MSDNQPNDPRPLRTPRPRAAYGFQPRMAIGVIYVLAFFFLYGMLFVLPELLDVLERMPPGEDQQAVAQEVAHQALGTNVYLALAAAIATVALGSYYRVLPGMKPPGL
jgi:hypothetical protein